MYDYSPEELQKLLDESNSYADLLEKLGMSSHGSNRITLRKIIDEYDLDLTKISENRDRENKRQLKELHSNKRIELEDILQNKVKTKTNRLLQMLIEKKYKEYKCECCGISEWNGKPITLQLHHKNGNHNDNDINNLEVLCPNCHSQTDNFAGKNVKRKPPVIKKEDEKKKALRGISEDGLRLYDGYGKYKVLCPVCKTNYMEKDLSQCVSCTKKEIKKYKETLVVKQITRQELKDRIRKESFISIAKDFKVSDKAITKWCKKYNLPFRKKDIKKYTNEEWECL